ncbi:MAG: hypothetical protein HS114_00435 [Anaerolineales bacterium]|nr:hypothetical protein [Anaerolineales bacterium]
MSMTVRELWTVIHGMGLGAIFLLAFAGGLAGLYSLRPEWVTITGVKERVMRLTIGAWVMAVASWLTVVSGAYIVYPWYRAKPPEGLTDLTDFPRYYLLSVPNLAAWHTFAMEWKEHVAWFSPILAVAVAFVVWRYGARIAEMPRLRYALMVLFVLAFAAAGIAGMFGAFITKAAPLM